MKFGEKLKRKMVEAWRNKYVRYDDLKKKIKEIKQLYENEGIEITDNSYKRMPEQIKIGDNDNDSRFDFKSVDENYIEMDSVYREFKEDKTQKILNIIQPQLTDKMPHFSVDLIEIKLKEQEFVLLLEQDIITVSKFYAEQCKYFADQHDALIQKVENLMRKNGDYGDDETVLSMTPRSTEENEENEENEESAESGLDVDEEQKYEKRTKKKQINIHEEKSRLRLLFRQIYNAIRMLQQYREINQTAFYKITKKHDKNSAKFKNLQYLTLSEVEKCNFGNDGFIKFLQKRLEYLYSLYLKPKQQTHSEALERLKAAPSTKKIQRESCGIGLCGGWSIAILLISAILVATLESVFWDSQSTYRSWYMFRASFLLSIYLWLWGADLWVFEKYKFNHALIFCADPTTLLRLVNIWNIAAIFTFTTMLFTIFYILTFIYRPNMFHDQVDAEIFAVILLCFWILYIFLIVPFTPLKHTKKFLIRSFIRQIISPFSTVEFIDFFIADQWTSLFTLVIDITFTMCYTLTGDFLLGGNEASKKCDSVSTKAWLSMLKLVPYWIRFWQCIRRTCDTQQKQKNLTNAGKYFCAILTVVVNAFHIYYKSILTEILSVLFGAITTIYAYFWDIIRDWGLLSKNKKHKWLRSEITYPPYLYYIAMILNLVFRLAWAISLYPVSFGIDISMHYVALPLNVIEVARRCMWNIFRIENEHLNNCGQFRVVKDVKFVNFKNIKSIKSDHDKNIKKSISLNNISLNQIPITPSVKIENDNKAFYLLPPRGSINKIKLENSTNKNVENEDKNENGSRVLIITRYSRQLQIPKCNDEETKDEENQNFDAPENDHDKDDLDLGLMNSNIDQSTTK